MAIPVSSSLTQLDSKVFFQEGFELSLDAIIPSIELTGSFTPFQSKTQFYIYDYSKIVLYENLNYNADGSYLPPPTGTSTSTSTSSYNQFVINPTEDIYNQGYSNGNYYAVYNFINYELGSELSYAESPVLPYNSLESDLPSLPDYEIGQYDGYPYFIKEISGDRTELKIQNNFLNHFQIQNYYNEFENKLNARENADEFYISFGNNRNFIGVNSQLEMPSPGSSQPISILIKLYKPLPPGFEVEQQLQIISKVGETQVFEVQFQPDLEFVDNLLSLKGPNYNVDIKDRINNSTNFKNLKDLINTNSSQSYYQFSSLRDQKGIILRKNWGDWNEFVKYSSAEQRLNNFYDKMVSIEGYEAELTSLETITNSTTGSKDYSSSYNNVTNNINKVISKFDSYEYFLYYITGSESWPKYTSTYPYTNYSYSSSAILDWFGSTDEVSVYYNSGKNQIYSASRYDNSNQDYLYYLIPPFITDNSSNDQYIKFVNMTGQTFDEMYIYTEAIEQVRNTNSSLTGSVLPLGLAGEVITSLGFDTYGNDFNSQLFDISKVGVPIGQVGVTEEKASFSFVFNSSTGVGGVLIFTAANGDEWKMTAGGSVTNGSDDGFGNTYFNNNESPGNPETKVNSFIAAITASVLTTWADQFTFSQSAVTPGTIDTVHVKQTTPGTIGNTAITAVGSPYIWMNPAVVGSLPTTFAGGVDGVIAGAATGSGAEYISRYIDIASGSVINYYDQQRTTLGYVIALADPSFPYPLENSAQEIYKRIFHNMVSLVKRKGTVTGLRQLINIWGVPSTMLRISEFGGKNKDDQNDYDLWMNRYSTAFNTYSTPHTSSIPNAGVLPNVNACVTVPWVPLYGNYAEAATPPDVAVPDCIQFRFKTAISTTAITNFSESLLFKKGNDASFENGDFGIYLHQSGSQSGSYSGASDPHYNTYASMSLVMSGSVAQGASLVGAAHVYITDPIYLPFYNKGWWTVQLQRKTHISASNEDNTLNEFELKVGQNIYDGYDGNQIGWIGSSSLTMIDSKVSQSMNESWNRSEEENQFSEYDKPNIYLPGDIAIKGTAPTEVWNRIGTKDADTPVGFKLGKPLSGSFQEFRYYRRALSSSQFNDLVMNPESIQGHADSNTGAGSSYDLLSFRAPLGNELEYTEPLGSASYLDYTSTVDNIYQFIYGNITPTTTNPFTNNSLGSIHPSVVNSLTSSILYTSSFFNYKTNIDKFTGSNDYALNFRFEPAPNLYVTSSYLTPNTEINYMDQPSAGIRNRIKNKIQVIDKNEYGTILSPFRSIQQEFEQSSSYTEDINSLEVGFSFQNEINDDIIATFGHGVVSDAIADPRFISESSDRYPELTRIAEDYFKKYQGYPTNTSLYNDGLPTVIEKEYDYNRLIKFYETSLFKAIKNYVPARTSLSTGIIVKQHLLERNKTDAVIGMHTNTLIAKTPETSSDSWGYTTQTGFNSVLAQQNLLITSSIGMYSLTGSAGGSVNKYNTPTSSIAGFTQSYDIIDSFTGDTITVNTQEEFYDGEFSGSSFQTLPSQYNPYRIYADGNDQTPDTKAPYVDFNTGGGPSFGTYFTVLSANQIRISTGYTNLPTTVGFTGSFHDLTLGETYKITYTFSNESITNPAGLLTDRKSYPGGSWVGYTSETVNGTYTTTFVATAQFAQGETGLDYPVDSGGVWFNCTTAGQTLTITIDSIVGLGTLGPKHLYPRDGWTIIPTGSVLFQNSPYNPILNNVSGSRRNSFLFDMDFDPVIPSSSLIEGIPSDYTLIVSASQLGWEGTATADALLEFSEVPDSNYTTPSIINPRYVGCLLESADYNFYTSIPSQSTGLSGIKGVSNTPSLLKQHKVRYINGETGSWGGDISYGKNAVIDRNPINFAHFKSSLESKEYYGTTTFNIDQLIQVPFEEILSQQSPIITSSLINGSNENLIPMSSTFMYGREATIIYNQTNKVFNNIGGTILNYTNLSIGSKEINAGGINFVAYQTNEIALNNLSITQYYTLPLWYSYKNAMINSVDPNFNIESTPNSASLVLTASIYGNGRGSDVFSYPGNLTASNNFDSIATSSGDPFYTTFYTSAPNPVYAFTGSLKDENNRDTGILYLRGPQTGPIPGMYFASADDKLRSIRGCSIALFNSINKMVKLGDIFSPTSSTNFSPIPAKGTLGTGNIPIGYIAASGMIKDYTVAGTQGGALPSLSEIEKNNNSNYYRLNLSGSNLLEYRDVVSQNINIEIGDEIRASYAYVVNENNQNILSKTYQDFTVIDYHQTAPMLFTNGINIYNETESKFEIACYNLFPRDPGVWGTSASFAAPLQSDGYYNFSSLKDKYQAAKNNSDTYILIGTDKSGNTGVASGSISGVSSHSEINGTGIIGITMSFAGFGLPDVDPDAAQENTYAFGTSYQQILDNSYAVGSDPSHPFFMSASVSPIIYVGGALPADSTCQVLDPGYLFDQVRVTPNPTELKNKIPTGRIYAMTIRKRQEADDRVVLNVNQPSGSAGALTLSGDGYLIPNDLTNIQQRNVQKIINKLKSENVFTQDSPDTLA